LRFQQAPGLRIELLSWRERPKQSDVVLVISQPLDILSVSAAILTFEVQHLQDFVGSEASGGGKYGMSGGGYQ
jgi:hypothetical protein